MANRLNYCQFFFIFSYNGPLFIVKLETGPIPPIKNPKNGANGLK